MKILIAPNSFRGSLNAFEVADSIEKGFKSVSSLFEIDKFPIADGGDHTAKILINALKGEFKKTEVLNPLGIPIQVLLGITKDHTAIVELACASGTNLLNSEELNPLNTTTFGTGQLIKAALDEGCRNFIIGIGGSATIDAGVGMLQALGVKFTDKQGEEIKFGGGNLHHINKIDISKLDKRIYDCKISVACDVENFLLGKRGAARVFGPQKGANLKQVEILEKNLSHYADQVQKFMGKNVENIKHGGTAGGVAVSLYAFFNAKLENGIELILDKTNFSGHLSNCNFVITAEGKIDSQTSEGKGPYGVAKRAKEAGKPVIALAGQVTPEGAKTFDATFSIINRPMNLKTALAETENLLFDTSKQIAKLVLKFLFPSFLEK